MYEIKVKISINIEKKKLSFVTHITIRKYNFPSR